MHEFSFNCRTIQMMKNRTWKSDALVFFELPNQYILTLFLRRPESAGVGELIRDRRGYIYEIFGLAKENLSSRPVLASILVKINKNFNENLKNLEIFILGFCWLCLAWCSCCRGVLPPPRLEILELLLGHLHSCLAFQFEIEASLLVNSSEKTNQPSRTLTNLLKIVGSPVRNYCV